MQLALQKRSQKALMIEVQGRNKAIIFANFVLIIDPQFVSFYCYTFIDLLLEHML